METSKQAGAELAAALTVVLPLTEMVDEYGELRRRKQERAPDDAREDYLRDEIEARYANLPADTATVAQGVEYSLQISAREFKRTITSPLKAFLLLRKQLTLEGLVALITIPLAEAIDKFIPLAKHPQFLTKVRSGPRRFVPVAKARPKAA